MYRFDTEGQRIGEVSALPMATTVVIVRVVGVVAIITNDSTPTTADTGYDVTAHL